VKVLIIGGGAVAEMFHIPSAIELLGVGNVFVAEPDKDQRGKLSAKFGLTNLCDDYKKALKSVDFVIIATPPHLHTMIMTECIKENLPILCEKPVTSTISESKSVLDARGKIDIPLGVCQTYRFFPNRIHVRKLIKEGYFGKEVSVNIQEGAPASWPAISGYSFRKELVQGGVLLNEGIHSLDFLLWCFGKPVDVEYYDDSIGGIESNASMKLLFKDNSQAMFRISRTCSLSNTIVIKSAFKMVELDIYDMNRIKVNNNDPETISKNPNNGLVDWTTIAKYQIEDFLEAINNNKKPMCTMEEGANVVELVEHCYRIKRSRPLPEKAPIPGIRW